MYIDYAFLIDELARVKETEKIRVDESEMNLKKKDFCIAQKKGETTPALWKEDFFYVLFSRYLKNKK